MAEGLLTYETFNDEVFAEWNQQCCSKDTMEVIKWAYQVYENDLVYACSFGAEGVVLLDLISKARPEAKVIFLDTDLHFKETYALIERIKERYPKLNIHITKPALSLSEQAAAYGEQLWLSQPNQCCQLRKIKPLEQALSDALAWMSGLRKEQSPTRADLQIVNQDHRFKKIKICPLIHWTWEEIRAYINAFDLTYNVLHDRGYPSIGCQPCTAPANPFGDSREGRWKGSGKTECGLHLSP